MATGGFKGSGTTDFLEEWKAKREKMRAKMLGDIAAASGGSNPERSPNCPPRPSKDDRGQCGSPDPGSGPGPDQDSPSPGKAKEKNSSGPSARKGKGQIEKRKLREKRRSTGVVSIPSNEVSLGGVWGRGGYNLGEKYNLLIPDYLLCKPQNCSGSRSDPLPCQDFILV